MAKDNKSFVGVWLPKEVHRSLNLLASQIGIEITELAAEMVEGGILEQLSMVNGTSDSVRPELALAQAYMRMRKQEIARFQLVSLMINVIQSASDDNHLEQVIRLCEENGFTLEEIRSQAEEMTRIRTAGIFSVGDGDTQTDRAVSFLNSLYKGINSIPAKEIELKAMQANIPLTVLKLAKRHLSLVSVRKGGGWHWELQYMIAPSNMEIKL